MADPLSIAATKLPGSSFDPVEFASEERKRLLGEQQARRTRYNELFDQVASVSGGNPWDEGLRDERNKIIEEGASSLAEGVDITDITNPQSGKQAAAFRDRISKLNNDAQMSKAIQDLVTNTRQMLAKDATTRGGNGAYDADATIKNIQELMGKRSIGEANKYLSEMGDNLLVAKPKYVNIPEMIKKNLPKAFQSSEKKLEGGQVVTRKYEEYSPQELKSVFNSMLIDPDTARTIRKEKEEDVTSMNESDLDYMMRTYGNQLARKQTFEGKEMYVPKGAKEEEDKPKYVVTNKTSNIRIGDYDIPVDDIVTFDQSKSFGTSLNDAIDPKTGKSIGTTDNVDFTPRRLVDVKVLKADTKIKGVVYKKGTIIRNPETLRTDLVETKRFVEGFYSKKVAKQAGTKEWVEDVEGTALKPYNKIQTEMDLNYKIGDNIPKQKTNENQLSSEDQQAYDWAKQNPNDPRAKKILTILNKK